MKNRCKLIGLALLPFLAFSTPILLKETKSIKVVNAEQHISNFADYTYSGNYYETITSSDEGLDSNLRKELSNKITPKSYPTYSGSSGDKVLAKLLQDADEDPTNSNNMIYFYTRDSVKKNAAQSWNREHTWPQSLSGGNWGKDKAGADLLHIRPTYSNTNSTRSNAKYGDLNKSGNAKEYNGMKYGWLKNNVFEPLDATKGDAARIIMYMHVAYQNVYSTMAPITNVFESYDTMLLWHINDKPDALEGHRNDVAESSLQENRNPFVDHPEYACKIFGSKASSNVKNLCNQTYPSTIIEAESITINNPIEAIKIGESYTFETTVNPIGASQNVYWQSSNEEVISFKDNIATANKEGEAVLRVYSATNENIYSEIKVIANFEGDQKTKNKTIITVTLSVSGGIIFLGGVSLLAIILIRKRKRIQK